MGMGGDDDGIGGTLSANGTLHLRRLQELERQLAEVRGIALATHAATASARPADLPHQKKHAPSKLAASAHEQAMSPPPVGD